MFYEYYFVTFFPFFSRVSGTECAIESYRAKSDIKNAVYSGFLTGGLVGFRAGHMGAIYGGCVFAAFSFAIEHFILEFNSRNNNTERDLVHEYLNDL